MGTVVQLIKMNNVKTSIIFFVVILCFNMVMIIVLSVTNFSIGYNLINNYPSPLELQIPTLSFFYSRRCTWVEITDVMIG